MKYIKSWIGMLLVGIVVFTIITSCRNHINKIFSEQQIITQWAEMATYITKNTAANSPTYASRCFGYIGLTAYESVVNGFDTHQSLVGQLNGLGSLPTKNNSIDYNWPLALNAAQAHIIRKLYNQTSDINKAKIDSLEKVFNRYLFSLSANNEVSEQSILYGRSVAESIFQWSKTDGGHRGYLKNFDKTVSHPDRPGSWKPPLYAQSFSHHPLHPHWGSNRTFVKKNSEFPIPNMISFDTLPTSDYYKEFLKVYEKDKILTQEEKEAAIWWGDDPDVTFTPPGHSYYLTTVAIKKQNFSLIKNAEIYAKTGMAVADAFINCWKLKYYYFSERPNTFIPKYIDREWESFWPDPPFPSFPSGHAIQAATAATVLEDIFGKNFHFIDSAHVGRERDEIRDVDFKERIFGSFWDFALETADSRFYGGIHTPQDNIVGLEEGVKIANNINRLKFTTE